MRAHKLTAIVQEDHQLELDARLPDDFPPGPAEVIVLATPAASSELLARERSLRALRELRILERTPEEERVLDEFESFRREHPVRFDSLDRE